MTKRCGCLKTSCTCTFDCSCVRCENPLNILKVVHQVPIERMQRDRCLIYNIIKNVSGSTDFKTTNSRSAGFNGEDKSII